ncbi:ArsR/SmtB family transcription factor [Cellulomonas triticagri]|uniref:ArsR family transcriptional regulator n=1 Tax=Cellulomonas triticagri TaxID=2483352 RepID=A0A3M2J8M4_9CELL|nr:ArsR family transcriptional regulator [Cellulomonas triticagri]
MPAQDPLSQVFSALADPLRRDIVVRLTAGDLTVRELAEPYDVTTQSVSKHLRVLEAAGLVSRRREAQRRPVHLEAEVFDLMTMWIERNRREAEFRYRRLDDVLLVEGEDAATGAATTAGAGGVAGGAVVEEVRVVRRVRPEETPAPAPVPAPVDPASVVVETRVERAPARVDRVVVEERDTEPRTLRVKRGRDRVFQPWDLQSRVVAAEDVDDPDGADPRER